MSFVTSVTSSSGHRADGFSNLTRRNFRRSRRPRGGFFSSSFVQNLPRIVSGSCRALSEANGRRPFESLLMPQSAEGFGNKWPSPGQKIGPDGRHGSRISTLELERPFAQRPNRFSVMDGDRRSNQELRRRSEPMPSIFKVAEAQIRRLRSEAEPTSALTTFHRNPSVSEDGIQISIEFPTSSDGERLISQLRTIAALSRFVPMRWTAARRGCG